MRSSWFGGLLTAASLVAAPAPAPAATPPPVVTSPPPAGAQAPAPVVTARYTFNGRSSSIIDESGHGHTLTVVSGHGGVVRAVAHGQGSALAFPARCTATAAAATACPHVALQTPSSADLNPGGRNLAYGADVLLAPGQTSSGQNVVQKGYSTSSSQWKLQVDGAAGRPSCVLVDDRRPAIRIVTSSVTAADGRWHALRCERAGTAFSVYVDGVLRGTTTVPARLSVTNDRPLSIGGKGAFADNDQFNGALDNVWVQIG
jgi:hypothetical protein